MKDKMVEELVYSICGTIVVADTGWASSIPEWIMTQIKLERLTQNMLVLQGKAEEEATDAEALAYLYTLTLSHPVSAITAEIYLFLN